MTRSEITLPPGPHSSAVWQLLRYSQSPLAFLEECAHRYGDPFTIQQAGYGSFVMLSSPDAVRDVFRGDSASLHAGEGIEFLNAIVGDHSVLVLDGERHARQRQALLPPFKGERMRSYFDVMQKTTLQILGHWQSGQKVRSIEPMQEITLRVMLQVVLGITSEVQLEEFATKVRRVLELARGRYGLILVKVLPIELLQRIRWLPVYRRLHNLDVALFSFIENYRRIPREERGETVLADLLEARHQNGQQPSNSNGNTPAHPNGNAPAFQKQVPFN